jgi:hypothetical protein
MSRALEFCENPQRQQRQQQHQQEYDDNNNEDNFFMTRVWLQKSGNEKTSVKVCGVSLVSLPSNAKA